MRPSCDALCASIGSPTTSPIAIDRRLVGLQLLVDLDEAARVDLHSAFSRAREFRSSACVRPRPAPGRRLARRVPAETSSSRRRSRGCHSASAFTAATVVLSRMASKIFSIRLCSGSTRSRSAPGSRPGSHLDDGDLRCRARRRPCPAPGRCSRRRPRAASSGTSGRSSAAGRVHHARRVELERWE